MADESHIGKVKYGRDDKLEADADELLSAGIRDNKRSIDRDIEKMSYESGLISVDELKFYDPNNDWDTFDEPSSVALVDPSGISYVSPSICSEIGDGNDRARNPRSLKRQALARHVGDSDNWGCAEEDIPALGANEGPRKTCSKCGQSKGLEMFSPHPNTKDGRRGQCKTCRR